MTSSMPQARSLPLITIAGPTASGKTGLAVELSRHFPVEVVSADSRQVYRFMDIGTAKPTREEREQVPHHLIDIVNPDQDFSAADFVRLGRAVVADIHSRGKLPLMVGGTGLYIQALTSGLSAAPGASPGLRRELREREKNEGPGTLYALLQQYDPETAKIIDPANLVRIVRALEVYLQSDRTLSSWQQEHAFNDRPYRELALAFDLPREELYQRINTRAEMMIKQGLVDETRSLLDRGYAPQTKSMRTIGYRECCQFLQGELSENEALEKIQIQTRRYAKRQLTWFRKYGNINWFESLEDFDKIAKLISEFLMK